MIKENDKDYTVKFEALGLGKEDLKVEIDDDCIIVTSDKVDDYYGGRYKRIVWMSDDVNKDEIRACCDKGILTLTLPKKLDKCRKRIEVE